METQTHEAGRHNWLLSIHEDSNANATLFRDGVPVFAVAEGRLSRVKYAGGFPRMAIDAALEWAGIQLSDITTVLPANETHFLPRIAGTLLPDGEHDYFGARHKAWLYFQHTLSRGGAMHKAARGLSRAMLKRKFPQLADFVDHHTAHAYSAYLTSGYPDAVAVTADNMGDGWSSKVFDCVNGRCIFQYGSSARHSPGQFYGEVAQLLGFHNLNAGKVTGLAAYGDPNLAYPYMEQIFSLDESKTKFRCPDLMWRNRRRAPFDTLSKMKPADVAAAAQKRFEDVLVDYVRHAVRETGRSTVVMAGGCFANVVLNQKILQLPEVSRIYVHPAMNDQGISMGAGLAHLAEREGGVINEPLHTVFLGPSYTEEEIGLALDAHGLPYDKPESMPDTAAQALAERKVIARYDGRLEYGPRALGNRTIMYPTDDRSVNDWLNKRLKRTEFMPFAPVTLSDHATECYRNFEGGELAWRYMTVTFEVTDAVRQRSPGIVHLDGTARPQVIHREDNPGYYDIIRKYHELTGTPTVINTSFNMHGEPIVCTPDDALRAFTASGLDHLILGPYFVRQKGSDT